MSIMKWSIETLRDQIPISLNSGSGNLASAASILSSISIPSDFPHGGLLRNIARSVSGIVDEVDNSKSWVIKKANDIEDAENRNKEIANGAFGSLFANTPDFKTEGSGLLDNLVLDKFRGTMEALVNTTIPEEGIQFETTTITRDDIVNEAMKQVTNEMIANKKAKTKTETIGDIKLDTLEMDENAKVKQVNMVTDGLTREELFKKDGFVYFYKEDGRLMKETFCPLTIEGSDALEETKKITGDLGYWVRDDGVCMFGDYVIVAADIPHLDGRTPRCRI